MGLERMRPPQGWSALSTALQTDLLWEARAYARENGIALARVCNEALREYLARREADPSLGFLAWTRRGRGAPSRMEIARRKAEAENARKRQGRPLAVWSRTLPNDGQPSIAAEPAAPPQREGENLDNSIQGHAREAP